jgi:hypothetical protein
LLRVIYRVGTSQGGNNVTASVFTGPLGQAGVNEVPTESVIVTPADATYQNTTVNFTGSRHFSAGDLVTLGIKAFSSPGAQNASCIWEFDMSDI